MAMGTVKLLYTKTKAIIFTVNLIYFIISKWQDRHNLLELRHITCAGTNAR